MPHTVSQDSPSLNVAITPIHQGEIQRVRLDGDGVRLGDQQLESPYQRFVRLRRAACRPHAGS